MKTELYHATRSGAVESLRRGIDSRRSQGFGQGAGFYLWRSKQRALQHAREMESAEYSKEVSVEGQPVVVVVNVDVTPEDFDVDYEVAGPAFLRFLEPNKDWITQHSAEIMAKVNFDGLGISIWGEGMPRRSMRFDSTELSVSQAQSLGRLAERISALEPEVMRRFELVALKQAEALKYVGSRPLYPSRVETLDGTMMNPYKAVIPIVSGIAYVSNPTDLEGRFIPERYLAGLPPALQKQRIRELTESRDAYKKGDYSELPTDRAARKMGLVKESSYTSVAKKRGIEWRGDAGDMAARVLQYYGAKATQRDVTAFAEALNMSFRKGLAAWKSGGHRPGATAQNWAVARVNSLVVGGKTAWTADQKQFAVLPADVRKKIVAKLPELYKALTAQGRGKDVASIKGKAKANPVVRPELRQMIGKELALDLKRPLYSYAKKMMAKYGSRAAGEELVDDAVHGAQDAIIGHFVNRYDDDMIEMYASIGDLYELRPIAIGVGQEAIRNLIRGSMYGAERPDLQFWERLKAQRRALTEPGGPPPSDEAVAASLGLTLDELNLKRQERQIFSTTSYDRLLGLGVDPGDRTIEVSEVLTYERPEGPPPEIEETTRGGREIMSMVSQGLDPEESTYLRQLGVDEIGGRLLADAIVQAAISRLDPNDRILVDTYVEGDTTLGMSDRQFERAIKGGYDPATRTRVPGLVDRVRPILLDTAEKVMALPEEVRDQIAVGKVDVFDAIRKDAARQKQLAARTVRMLGSGPAPAAPKKVPRLRAFRNR